MQVIPKDHHRWVWDVPNVGEYFEVARKVALAQKKAYGVKAAITHRTKSVGMAMITTQTAPFPAKREARLRFLLLRSVK